MRIAYVCNEYPLHSTSGGIGTFTRAMACGLVERGHEVTVVGFGKDSGEWRDEGVKVVIRPETTVRGFAWFINRRRLYGWLKHNARAGEIDIIELPESHGLFPFPFRWCPVVVRLHTSRVLKAACSHVRFLEKRTLQCHRNWIAVSRHILNETLAAYDIQPDRSQIVYNAVCDSVPNGWHKADTPQKYVLFVGAVRESKGAFVLAEAARSFLTEHGDLHLVYVGRLTEENGQRADGTILRIVGAELAKRVHFTGPIRHNTVLSWMSRATVVALPSKHEAFGLAPAEAMSCGVPVVYSNTHAGPEVIDDGVTGLLADPCSPSDVARKVQCLLNNPALAAQLASNGQRTVRERFSLSRCIDETLAFYRCVLAQRYEPGTYNQTPV